MLPCTYHASTGRILENAACRTGTSHGAEGPLHTYDAIVGPTGRAASRTREIHGSALRGDVVRRNVVDVVEAKAGRTATCRQSDVMHVVISAGICKSTDAVHTADHLDCFERQGGCRAPVVSLQSGHTWT
jgi:hypothetical protein